ncbi:MAG TPA: hypothetical protein VFW75_06720 [Acetobacteraceae bacterium]|nr:hypothetical protein [Acetobacteraceae bacterium]
MQAVFPLSLKARADPYLEQAEKDQTYKDNTAALRAEIPALPKDSADIVFAHAKDRLAGEHARQDSIISRAQALLVAQAVLSALLTVGGTALGHLEAFSGWRAWAICAVAFYVLVQTALLTVSALRAVGGLGYPAIATSTLLRAMATTADDLVRRLAVETLLNYRVATVLNSWRFIPLSMAQRALRNTALAFALLVLMTFGFTLSPWAGIPPPPPTLTTLPGGISPHPPVPPAAGH